MFRLAISRSPGKVNQVVVLNFSYRGEGLSGSAAYREAAVELFNRRAEQEEGAVGFGCDCKVEQHGAPLTKSPLAARRSE